MSGGSDEYVMGNMGTSTGQTSGIYQYNSRMTGDNYTYVGFEKYLTTYAYGASNYNQAAYNRGRLGDATSEVILSAKTAGGWYNQTSYFVQTSIPWFTRGGVFASGGGAKSGIFSFWYAAGYDDYMISTRAALSVIAS